MKRKLEMPVAAAIVLLLCSSSAIAGNHSSGAGASNSGGRSAEAAANAEARRSENANGGMPELGNEVAERARSGETGPGLAQWVVCNFAGGQGCNDAEPEEEEEELATE